MRRRVAALSMPPARWWSATVILLFACGGEPRSPQPPAAASPPPSPPAPAPVANEPPSKRPVANADAAPSSADIEAFVAERDRLLSAGQFDQAEQVCLEWIVRTHPIARAEGCKCSANVLVRRARDAGEGLMISDSDQRLTQGGLAPRPRFSGESIGKAINRLDQAAELNPIDVSIHQGRMFLVMASGDYARAVTSLEKSLAQIPEASADTWLEYMGRFPRTAAKHAVAYARMLTAKYPANAVARTELGAWLAVAGKHDEAKTQLEKALELDDDSAMAHWRLGEVLQRRGDRGNADSQYKRSLALDGVLAEERQSAYEHFKKPRR